MCPPRSLEQLERTGEVRKTLTLRSPVSGVVTVKNVVEGARITPGRHPLRDHGPGPGLGPGGCLRVRADPGEGGHARGADPGRLPGPHLQGPRRLHRSPGGSQDPHGQGPPRVPQPQGRAEAGDVRRSDLPRPRAARGSSSPWTPCWTRAPARWSSWPWATARFEPREVETGASLGESVEILKGLKAGEEVVTRANFLVDSESRLKAALAQMTARRVPMRQRCAACSSASSGHPEKAKDEAEKQLLQRLGRHSAHGGTSRLG